MNLAISTIKCLLPCALLTLTACAPLASQQAEYPAGRARLALPAGAWEDLGTSDQAVRLLPQPDGRIALQSRVLGLRGAQQELLAVRRVQTNRGNDWQGPMFWTGSCLPQQGVAVEDATKGSRVRVDCLRFKRWVDGPQWLEKNQPDFARWLLGRKLAAGSRIVVTLGVIKQPDRQLNLGSGKDPSDETIADAGAPLEIRWRGSSYLDLPLRE